MLCWRCLQKLKRFKPEVFPTKWDECVNPNRYVTNRVCKCLHGNPKRVGTPWSCLEWDKAQKELWLSGLVRDFQYQVTDHKEEEELSNEG